MLDARAERTLTEVAEQLRTLCGERLLCVAMYGSGASPDFIPGSSDLNLVVVLSQIDRATMIALRTQTAAWHKRHVATPLVVDRAFLQTPPMSFLWVARHQDNHRLLVGRMCLPRLPSMIATCAFSASKRVASSPAARAGGIGDSRGRLQSLILDSLKTFSWSCGRWCACMPVRLACRFRRRSTFLPAVRDVASRDRATPAREARQERWSANADDVFHSTSAR
jgi:hypothetical protein